MRIQHAYHLFNEYRQVVVAMEQRAGKRPAGSFECQRQRDALWCGPTVEPTGNIIRRRFPFHIEFERLKLKYGGNVHRDIDIFLVIDIEAVMIYCLRAVGAEPGLMKEFRNEKLRGQAAKNWINIPEGERRLYVDMAKERMRAVYGQRFLLTCVGGLPLSPPVCPFSTMFS